MAYRPSRVWILLALSAAALLISSAGCRAPDPGNAPVAGGGRTGLTSPAAVCWQSHSTFTAGRLQLDFELEARARARILPDLGGGDLPIAPEPTEPY